MSRLNRHFSFHDQTYSNKNERDLIRGLHQETIQIAGYEIVFIPLEVVDLDIIWGEDPRRKFSSHYRVPIWLETFEGFNPGGPDVIDPFGYSVQNEMFIQMSSKEFQDIEELDRDTPKEGDLIFFELTKSLFEIKWVEDDDQFYPLAQQMTYRCQCRAFEYSHEELATSHEDTDSLEEQELSGPDVEDIPEDRGENVDVEDEADSYIDWSEGNPFGQF